MSDQQQYETFTEFNPSSSQDVQAGEKLKLVVDGYKQYNVRVALTILGCFLSGGLGFLILYWRPDWRVRLTNAKSTLADATTVVCTDNFKKKTLCTVKTSILSLRNDDDTDGTLKARTGQSRISLDCCLSDRIRWATLGLFKAYLAVEKAMLDENKFCEYRRFKYKRTYFVWNDADGRFEQLCFPDIGLKCQDIVDMGPLSQTQRNLRSQLFGNNSIETGITPLMKILFGEVLTKFYVFQIFSVLLWFFDEYMIYAGCIVFISVVSITLGVYQTRKNERKLHELSALSGLANVCVQEHSGKQAVVPCQYSELVPGDIVHIHTGMTLPCDMLLLDGNALANESSLTGESVPVTKTAFTFNIKDNIPCEFNVREYNRHMLYSGTTVMQTRFLPDSPVRALAIRTGFGTLKGELIKGILYPNPVLHKFEQDVTRFIKVLAVIAGSGMIVTLITKVKRGEPGKTILLRCLDLITICVPPALPAGLQAGLVYAQRRLKKRQIFCISQNLINMSGTVDTVVFDKTGTLTEDGLDMKCVLVNNANPTSQAANASGKTIVDDDDVGLALPLTTFADTIESVETAEGGRRMMEAMACCHTLTRIEGVLSGDPIDLKMFEFTCWSLVEPPVSEESMYENIIPSFVVSPDKQSEIAILKTFPFVSQLQRMSVIVRQNSKSSTYIFCKGSPEKVLQMCSPNSVPDNFNSMLDYYTRQGYRVLAVASRPLKVSYHKLIHMDRANLEQDLVLNGLVVMENRLKPQTEHVISQLKRARLRLAVCTGDNLMTATSVSRDCGIIDSRMEIITLSVGQDDTVQYSTNNESSTAGSYDHDISNNQTDPASIPTDGQNHELYVYALDGKTWSFIRDNCPKVMDRIVGRGVIFARMLPEQKQQLIETFQNSGMSVAMCGDGANDCGALKAANTGVSLSTTEASVASPFTSLVHDISCVPALISEGRCSLVTSFGVIKFICTYSIIQFLTVSILYNYSTLLSDGMFMYIDMGLLYPLVAAFSLTKPTKLLWMYRPPLKLFCLSSLLGLFSQVLVSLVFQLSLVILILNQPWYQKTESGGVTNDHYPGYIVTALFLLSNFHYIGASIVFSRGHPHRLTILKNWIFLLSIVACYVASIFLVLSPANKLTDILGIRVFPAPEFRYFVLAFVALSSVLMWILEKIAMAQWSQKLENVMEAAIERLRLRLRVVKRTAFKSAGLMCEMTSSSATDWLQHPVHAPLASKHDVV